MLLSSPRALNGNNTFFSSSPSHFPGRNSPQRDVRGDTFIVLLWKAEQEMSFEARKRLQMIKRSCFRQISPHFHFCGE